jgi:outer membrane protein assembly factor BamD
LRSHRQSKLFLLILAVALLALLPRGAAWAGRNDRLTPQQQYDLGERYLKRGMYTKALEQFNRLRNYNRDDPIAVRAELAIADVYYKKSEFDQARSAYEDFERMHPRYDRIDYVLFREGMCIWKNSSAVAARDQTPTRDAVNVWSSFEARFPQSSYAPDVHAMLQKGRDRLAHKEYIIGAFYYRRKAWRAVNGRLEEMLRLYPDSPDRPEALELLGESAIRSGDVARGRSIIGELQKLGGHENRVRSLERILPSTPNPTP